MITVGNKDNFDSLVSDGVVIVDFYANWCGPCKMLAPVLEEVSSSLNIKIVKIDCDREEDLARRFGIMSIPTLLLYKNGNLVSTKNGYLPMPLLEAWIKEN